MTRSNFTIFACTIACMALSACSDKMPGIQTNAPAIVAPEATATAEPNPTAIGTVATALSSWSGDVAASEPSQLCAMDAVNGSGAKNGGFVLPAGQPATFEGWLATTDLRAPTRFAIVLDGSTDFQVTGGTGASRDDVAKAYGTSALTNAGFKLELATLEVPVGDYSLVLVHEENGRAVACGTNATLVVR